MIKNTTVSKDDISIDNSWASSIGPFSKEELTDMVQSGIVDVYRDDVYVARMSRDDYFEYSETFGVSVEDRAYELLTGKKDELLRKYPGSSIQDIIGFVLAQQLYENDN